MYNTGARASEAVGLSIRDLRFETPAQVRILGKGRKERACPLWPETADALHAYLKARDDGDRPDAPVFLNAHGRRLGRFGVVTVVKPTRSGSTDLAEIRVQLLRSLSCHAAASTCSGWKLRPSSRSNASEPSNETSTRASSGSA